MTKQRLLFKASPRSGGALSVLALGVLGLGLAAWHYGHDTPPSPEGIYVADDGEGTSIRLQLMAEGRARLWQGYPDGDSFPGRYHREGDQLVLNMEGQMLVLVAHGDCLAPFDAPDQQLCPPR